MWEDLLLSASLGRREATGTSPHVKPQGTHEEATNEQVPPPEIDFSLEALKNEIKVL